MMPTCNPSAAEVEEDPQGSLACQSCLWGELQVNEWVALNVPEDNTLTITRAYT